MKVKQMIEEILKDGWFLARQKGSHRQFKHKVKEGVVTIAGKDSMELHPKTKRSILKQAKIKPRLISGGKS